MSVRRSEGPKLQIFLTRFLKASSLVLLNPLNPASTDFRGPRNCICCRRNSVIANIGFKQNEFKGQGKSFVIGGIPLKARPLERNSTIFLNLLYLKRTHPLEISWPCLILQVEIRLMIIRE